METYFKLLSVFVAGFFAAFVGPFIKSKIENLSNRKSPKIQNAHEIYDELIYYIINGETSDDINLSRLKSKLLTYGKDDVIQLATQYISVKDKNDGKPPYDELYKIINKIRDELKMGTDFDSSILRRFIEL